MTSAQRRNAKYDAIWDEARRLGAFDAPVAHELAAAGVDTERAAKIDAARVTLQFGAAGRRLDVGKRSIEDSPLFGGERQAGLFE